MARLLGNATLEQGSNMTQHPEIRYTQIQTRLGAVWLAATANGLAGFWFDGQRHFNGPGADWIRDPEWPLFARVEAQWRDYERGILRQFDLPLDPQGTAFQQSVWRALLTIPFGNTVTYAALARTAGAVKAVRAVGAAIGRNPISVIVPCHRVLGSDGSLTGYAGGLERKQSLLTLEGARI